MIKSLLARNIACDAIVDLVDQGSDFSSGQINIYNPDSTLLTFLPLSYPAYGTAVDGTSVAYVIYDATAFIDGTASHYEVVNRDSTVIWTGSISNNSGIGDMKLNSTVIFKDSTIAIQYAFFAVPA